MEINILPDDVIAMVRAEGNGLEFGCVSLNIFLRNGKPRWEVSRSKSIMDEVIQKSIDTAADLNTKESHLKKRSGYGL